MNIHIIGAGAIGKLLAVKLSAVYAPLLITRTSAQSERIHSTGIRLYDQFEQSRSAHIVRCMDQLRYRSEIEAGRLPLADLVLLTVKQPQISDELMATVRMALGVEGILIAFQNGIGHLAKLQRHIPHSQTALAILTEGAKTVGPADVEHTGKGWMRLGFPIAEVPVACANRLEEALKCLRAAGFDASLSNDITIDAWNKLVINSVINPLTAIYGLTNGELLNSAYLIWMMRNLFVEAISAAKLVGIELDPRLWDQLLEVCRRTARNRSSMLQDIDAGRQTEIEWINGSLIRTARAYGSMLPAHEAVYQAVSGIERSR